MDPKLSDGQKIRLRKVAEETWLEKWKGHLTDPDARLDLFRFYLWKGIITLAEFRRIKCEHNKSSKAK